MSEQIRFLLNESDLPRTWYNILADSPVAPSPVLNPQTMEPVTPDFLAALFPMGLIEQEISQERFIDIPEEVREIYKLWRPTPLLRARRLFDGSIARDRAAVLRRAPSLSIEADAPLGFHTDGEPHQGGTRIEVETITSSLLVRVPPGSVS